MRNLFCLAVLFTILFTLGCEEAAKELSTTVSGYVKDDETPVGSALVFLLSYGDTASTGMSLDNGSITNSSGRYVIVEVQTGDYFVCAVKDNNGNMTYDSGVDAIGYYGDVILGITIPEKFTVQNEGDDIDSINIEEMYVSPIR